MPYNYIMMKVGYVENNQVAWLMYGCEFFGIAGFPTMKEAITVLAEDLYSKFIDEELSQDEAMDDADMRDFILHDFPDFVRGLHSTTCDSYGEAEQTRWMGNRDLSWWPFWADKFPDAVKNDTVIWIGENAENVLLGALYDAKPELRPENDDDIGMDDWAEFKSGIQPAIV